MLAELAFIVLQSQQMDQQSDDGQTDKQQLSHRSSLDLSVWDVIRKYD